ncbi:MAG: alpha/beta hydrolase-fold protein [Rhodothermales bacterium]
MADYPAKRNPLDLTGRMSRPWILALVVIGALAAWILLSGCAGEAGVDSTYPYASVTSLPEPTLGITGRIDVWPVMPSEHVEPREVQIWLPPGYEDAPEARYPVVYVHDGQNLFDPSRSPFSAHDWALDEIMTALVDTGAVRPAIVVGIESRGMRILEMAPEDIMTGVFPPDTLAEARRQLEAGVGIPASAPLLGNEYLAFVVDEIIPRVNAEYRTLTGPENTFIMGSSMGGLASIYALVKRPDVFGAAAALSTSWHLMGDYMLDWIAAEWPRSADVRLYMDHGTGASDRSVAPYQNDMDALLGTLGASYTSHVFEDAEHSEIAWRMRAHLPLQYLLGRVDPSRASD